MLATPEYLGLALFVRCAGFRACATANEHCMHAQRTQPPPPPSPPGRPPPPDASPNPNLRTPSTPFQDVRPSTPFVHCAWHVLSAVAVATTEALVEGAEDRLLAAGAGGGG